ncbi:unnamed protein product [Bemisia tabaci]|uniref:AAA-ATPase-like domain-containing protein n=1 Tax=Bemisia tabaci TaxID=7038 RepID=A0A9P0EXN0_BEMTA|nr:unnamed protein product [Bemisia tabaci]
MERTISVSIFSMFHVFFLQDPIESAVTQTSGNTTNGASQITDFKEFIDYHRELYVDKTLFLPDFIFREEKYMGPIIFVTKPPGFGKSLLASTVDYFFNSKYDVSQTRRIFAGFHVMTDTPEVKKFRKDYMNRFPVIKISFASFQASDYDGALEEVERIFREVIEDHADVAAQVKDPILDRISNGTADKECLYEFVQLLCGYVTDHHTEDPILIVDAYDTPLYSTYAAKYFHKMANLMSYFFEGIFNDGFHRFRKALITGVATAKLERVRIRKEVTRAKVDDHDPLAEYFGFTKEEVITLMARNGRHRGNQGTYRTVVRSFGGYGFRDFNVTMFNPSGVIRYFEKGTLDGGVDTATTTILKDLLTPKKYGLYPILAVQKLLAYEEVLEGIPAMLLYPDIRESSTQYWTFLLNFGLATVDLQARSHPEKITLKLPNLTVRTLLTRTLAETPEIPDYNNLTESLVQGDYETVQIAFKTYLEQAGYYVMREDKYSERFVRFKRLRLSDYVIELLGKLKLSYNTNEVTVHNPGVDYIELVPNANVRGERYKYTIRVRIEKTKMLRAAWNRMRNKICTMVRTIQKNETEIFVQYGKSFVDVCLRRYLPEMKVTTRRYVRPDWE